MPRFTGQNKKNVNPRWFMDEKQEIVKEEIDFDKLDDMSDDDERESIRGLSKDLTGKKDSYMIPDNFESMSREELIDLVKDMMASPEGQDFERDMRDEEDREIGMQDDELDNSPKRLGMGRMKEEYSDPNQDHPVDMYDPENPDRRVDPTPIPKGQLTPAQVLSDEVEAFKKKYGSEFTDRELGFINFVEDGLYFGFPATTKAETGKSKEDYMQDIENALKSGDEGLMQYFKR